MAFFKSKKDVISAVSMFVWFLGFVYLVFWQSAWWMVSAPIYGFVALSASVLVAGDSLRLPPNLHKGIEIKTQLLTVGDEKKNCTLIVCKDHLAISTGKVSILAASAEWEAEGKPGNPFKYREKMSAPLVVPLAAITGFLLQKMPSFTGFGIDYTDEGGKARLMFVNMGDSQGKRTRKILKAIQDAYVAMAPDLALTPPAITDVGRAIKKAADSVVHRVEQANNKSPTA